MADPISDSDNSDDKAERFYTLYGKALATWADLESALSDWFDRAIQPVGGKDINATSIFYSARSFTGRADMLKAATASELLTKDERTFIRKALKVACEYNKFRAKLAHRVTIRKGWLEPFSIALHEGDDPFGIRENDPKIDAGHLENATLNINGLAWTIWVTAVSGGITPQEGLRRVNLLPKEPHLHADIHLLEELHADPSTPLH